MSVSGPESKKVCERIKANVSEIPGTQRAGRVSEEDVRDFVKSQVTVNKEK